MREQTRELSHGQVRFVDVGEGPAILLIHGLGGSWQNWRENLGSLAARHRVVAIDLPGFGGSAAYRGEVTIDRYVDTLMEFLDELGIRRAALVGNSMGGLLTIEAAVRHPERVAAAVLVSSGGIPLTARRDRLLTIPLARLVNRVLRIPAGRRIVLQSPRLRRLIVGRVFHDPHRMPKEVLSSAISGLDASGFGAALAAADDYDARVRAPAVACPTLVVWGQEDQLLPVWMGGQLHDLIPHSVLEVWEATGHCAMVEHPGRFNERVVRFLAPLTREVRRA